MGLRKRVSALLGGLMLAYGSAAWADSSLTLAFLPSGSVLPAQLSPEGCHLDPSEVANGLLAPPPDDTGECHSAVFGAVGVPPVGLLGNPHLQTSAVFTSAPFENGLDLAGAGTLVVHFADAADCAFGAVVGNGGFFFGEIFLELYDVGPDGSADLFGDSVIHPYCEGLAGEPSVHNFNTGSHLLPPSHRLRLRIYYYGELQGMRLLYGGDSLHGPAGTGFCQEGICVFTGGRYGDSGITLAVRDQAKRADGTFGGGQGGALLAGALPFVLLVPLMLAGLLRRCVRQPTTLNPRHIVSAIALSLSCNAALASTLDLRFIPASYNTYEVLSPEGCHDDGSARGGMATPFFEDLPCHSGYVYRHATDPVLGAGVFLNFSFFESTPFAAPVELAGPATITLYLPNTLPGSTPAAELQPDLTYLLCESPADRYPAKCWNMLSSGTVMVPPYGFDLGEAPHSDIATFDVGRHRIGAGGRLILFLRFEPSTDPYITDPTSQTQRMLYGGTSQLGDGDYRDSGIRFELADAPKSAEFTADAKPEGSGLLAGAFGGVLLLPLLIGIFARRQRPFRTEPQPLVRANSFM